MNRTQLVRAFVGSNASAQVADAFRARTVDCVTFDSGLPGVSVAVMAGVHGNEKSGVIELDRLVAEMTVTSGKVIFVLGNLAAMEADRRCTEKNMNRCFRAVPAGNTYEDLRAAAIVAVLGECDALLDVHNTLNKASSVPFLISEYPEWDQYFPVPLSASGFDALHPGGSDGYMNSIGKTGLCVECGSIYDRNAEGFARRCVENFLKASGCVAGRPEIFPRVRRLAFDRIYKNASMDFRFDRQFKDFEPVKSGQLIATDGGREVRAQEDSVLTFPHVAQAVGDEMFVLGRDVTAQTPGYRS